MKTKPLTIAFAIPSRLTPRAGESESYQIAAWIHLPNDSLEKEFTRKNSMTVTLAAKLQLGDNEVRVAQDLDDRLLGDTPEQMQAVANALYKTMLVALWRELPETRMLQATLANTRRNYAALAERHRLSPTLEQMP